eukprot:gene10858-12648_t
MQGNSYRHQSQGTIHYLEYRPSNIVQGSRLPVLVFLHGGSKGGSGVEGLIKLREAVIPKYIDGGHWGDLPFLVICPQTSGSWTHDCVKASLQIAFDKYRDDIDATRVYLVGQSMGGAGIYRYYQESKENCDVIAASVIICAASSPSTNKTNYMAKSNIPLWLVHNDEDNMIPCSCSEEWLEYHNKHSINPPAKLTILKNWGHDAWTATLNPDRSKVQEHTTLYVYDWLLSHTTERVGKPSLLERLC